MAFLVGVTPVRRVQSQSLRVNGLPPASHRPGFSPDSEPRGGLLRPALLFSPPFRESSTAQAVTRVSGEPLNRLKRLQFAGLAQLVEHLICNQGVGGSNPSAGTNTQRRSASRRSRSVIVRSVM